MYGLAKLANYENELEKKVNLALALGAAGLGAYPGGWAGGEIGRKVIRQKKIPYNSKQFQMLNRSGMPGALMGASIAGGLAYGVTRPSVADEEQTNFRKIANEKKTLEELSTLYDQAYQTSTPPVPKRSLFRSKRQRPSPPVYTPEQRELQSNLYENHRGGILDQVGKQIRETGTYTGPSFKGLFEDGVMPLNDPETVNLIKKYPRLLDAMKDDGREDRGGIVWNFQNNLDHYKHDPEAQNLIYRTLEKQLDNNEFYGWKSVWEDPHQYLREYVGE